MTLIAAGAIATDARADGVAKRTRVPFSPYSLSYPGEVRFTDARTLHYTLDFPDRSIERRAAWRE